MPMETIIKGSTRLVVPDTDNELGPASRARIFYNPAMRSNRDITVLFGMAAARDGWKVLDALGGTGSLVSGLDFCHLHVTSFVLVRGH